MTGSRLSLWPGLPPGVYARRASDRLPFPLDDPRCRLFAWARHGLWRGVRELGLGAGDEVLVPAYHHGSEIEALRRAGLVCRFYDVGETLEPDAAELDSLTGPRTRALHLIHYFGFPQEAARWRAWCDQRGLFLFEDVAQAWLATVDGAPAGSFGDLAIFCPYKTFGIPHIGVLRTHAPPARFPSGGLELGSVARLHAKWLTARWGWLDQLSAPVERMIRRPRGDDQALGDPAGPSRSALFLLPRVADAVAGATRRANYPFLLSELTPDDGSPFARLPPGAVPLVFPVMVDRPVEVLDRLEGERVLARPFWPTPHRSLPADRFPGAASWRDRLVALPVHQELRQDDLARIVNRVRASSVSHAGHWLESIGDLDSIRDEWSRLARQTGNVFSSWEWNSIWWRHFGGGQRLRATAVRSESGRLVAILPLYVWSAGPLRVLRFIGHGPGDELGPIAHPSDGALAARALGLALAESRIRWGIFLGERLPGDRDWASLLAATVQRREASPAIRLGGRTSFWRPWAGASATRCGTTPGSSARITGCGFASRRTRRASSTTSICCSRCTSLDGRTRSSEPIRRSIGSSPDEHSSWVGSGCGSWRSMASRSLPGTGSASARSSPTTRVGGIRRGLGPRWAWC